LLFHRKLPVERDRLNPTPNTVIGIVYLRETACRQPKLSNDVELNVCPI